MEKQDEILSETVSPQESVLSGPRVAAKDQDESSDEMMVTTVWASKA